MQYKIASLLKDYSIEEILERGNLDVVEALELLVTYGALSLSDIVEATDGKA